MEQETNNKKGIQGKYKGDPEESKKISMKQGSPEKGQPINIQDGLGDPPTRRPSFKQIIFNLVLFLKEPLGIQFLRAKKIARADADQGILFLLRQLNHHSHQIFAYLQVQFLMNQNSLRDEEIKKSPNQVQKLQEIQKKILILMEKTGVDYSNIRTSMDLLRQLSPIKMTNDQIKRSILIYRQRERGRF